jgi:hypothetical protein
MAIVSIDKVIQMMLSATNRGISSQRTMTVTNEIYDVNQFAQLQLGTKHGPSMWQESDHNVALESPGKW